MRPWTGTAWIAAVMENSRSITVVAARLHHRRQAWENQTQPKDTQLLVVVERGSMEIVLGSGPVLLRAGCGCWCPAGPARGLRSSGGVERHFNLRLRGTGDLARGPVAKPVFRSGLWAVLPLLHRLRDQEVLADDLRSRALVAAVAADVLASPPMEGSRPSHGLGPDQRAHLEAWVSEHLQDGIEPADLAQVLGLSPDYATRCFRATYGVAPRRWLRDERVRKAAADLVDEDLTIAAVSERYGFTDASFFCRQFRQVMGCTPETWRRGEQPAERIRS